MPPVAAKPKSRTSAKPKSSPTKAVPPRFNEPIFYIEKEGNFMIGKGTFYVWLYEDANADKKLESGEYDFVMFPWAGYGSPFSKNYVPPLLAVFDKRYQQRVRGSDKLIGIVSGSVDSVTKPKRMYVTMMATRKDWRRKGVNSYLVKSLRESLGLKQNQVEFVNTTANGRAFELSGKFRKGGNVKSYKSDFVPVFYDDSAGDLSDVKPINALLRKIGSDIVVKYYVGSGYYGTAWVTKAGTILKITENSSEAYSAMILCRYPNLFKSQCRVYNCFMFTDGLEKRCYIEKEKLTVFSDVCSDFHDYSTYDIRKLANDVFYEKKRINVRSVLEQMLNDYCEQYQVRKKATDLPYAEALYDLCLRIERDGNTHGVELDDITVRNIGFRESDGKLYCFDAVSSGDRVLRKGGAVEDKKEVFRTWRRLVNMSKSELQKFYDSEEGKNAGLSTAEARAQGIDSGRESARWIMRMKSKPVHEWGENEWRWAKKQISFISRMRGNKGELYDENGNKTRKHTSLLIWGHNPKKYESGGELNNTNHNAMDEIRFAELPAIQKMSRGMVIVLKDTVFDSDSKYAGDRFSLCQVLDKGKMVNSLQLKIIKSSGAYAFTPGVVIERPLQNILNRGRQASASTEMKKGGELNPDSDAVKQYFAHAEGDAGGVLVGKRHSEGGIKAVNNGTGQPLEMEGGEVVITRNAVSDETLREFEGKKMTNRQILSAINVSGGGVAFAKGGETVDKEVLAKAAAIEMKEHEATLNQVKSGQISVGEAAEKIAASHLRENPRYYEKS